MPTKKSPGQPLIRILKMRDLTEPIIALANDVLLAEHECETHNDAFHRRNYIRALFAMIEGSVYLLKQTALSAALRSRFALTLDEVALLREQTVDLDSAGAPRRQPKFLRLASNLRFTVACVNRVFRGSVVLDVSNAVWRDFNVAIQIRNRITHPKGLEDLEVSSDEALLCRRVSDDLINDLIAAMTRAILDGISKASSTERNKR